MPEYTKEQFWKLYEKLPEELQEAIFSVKTADSIYDICQKNEIDEVSKVAKLVGQVLVGLLPPGELQQTLTKELDLKPETAKNVFREISRFIFYPIEEGLSNIYRIEIIPSKKVSSPEKPTPKKPDVYREPIK